MAGGVRRIHGLVRNVRAVPQSRTARLIAAVILVGYWALLPVPETSDAANMWQLDLSNPYGRPWGAPDSFVYSPAIALLMAPLTELPFEVFYRALLAANLVAIGWMLGPVGAAVALLLPPVQVELQTGNVHLLMAAAVVAGFRHPAFWAWPILTKVTPAVGLLWFAARREWRPLVVAVASTSAIVLATWVLLPGQWTDWMRFLSSSATVVIMNFTVVQIPMFVRLPIAAGIAIVAGWRGDRWLVPFAVLVALPAIWIGALTLLLAIVPLAGPPARSARIPTSEAIAPQPAGGH